MIREITVCPSCFSGKIEAVVSKSDAHRALIAAALAQGKSQLSDWGDSDDIKITLAALEKMGLARREENFALLGGGQYKENMTIHCGQSGSTLRFLIPLSVVLGNGAVFTGEGRLMQRPLTVYQELCTERGIQWSLEGNTLTVKGHLCGGEFHVPGNISSQFITGLCFALPQLAEDSYIHFTTPLESYSYIRMTLDTLARFGITIIKEDSGLRIPGGQKYQPVNYRIEGDWSYGAFWLVGGAINGDVSIENLRMPTLQGDSRVVEILKGMGARIDVYENSVHVQKSELQGTLIDLADVPDLAPVLAIAACAAHGTTEFIHARRLRIKESDRLEAIRCMVESLGADIEAWEDSFVICGRGALRSGAVDTQHDHRMAMAGAIASGIAQGEIRLNDKDCVAKSAPAFWEHFVKLGGLCYE